MSVPVVSALVRPFDQAPASAAVEHIGGRGLARLTVWRLLVAWSALLGVALAALQYDVWWTALSQLSSLAVGVSYLGLAAYPFLMRGRRHEPTSPWLRGALTTLMLLVSLTYLVMPAVNLTDPFSVVEHVVTPALVVADFLLVGRNQAAVRWWHPATWLLPPLAYVFYYVLGDLRVYVALDASQPGPFTERLVMLLGLLLSLSLLVYAVGRGRARGAAGRSARR